jgi:protoporphyrinogen oxidase
MLKNAFAFPSRKKSRVVKSLIGSFNYPRRGPGMMWDACAKKMQAQGGELSMGRTVVGCAYDASAKIWRLTLRDAQGGEEILQANEVISSAPLRELAEGITPGLPPAVLQAAGKLRYRDFLIVALILPDRQVFSDNWIYIHDPSVKVGRVQNFKSWSPEMVPDPAMCCYGLEYFCFEGDGLWTASDESLVALAKKELEQIGLGRAADVADGCVVRQKKAYPVYDDEYALHVDRLRQEFEKNYPTLHLVGRNGMHKYNNQDHAMMTAMLCVENILAGRRVYDLWRVNQDAEYLEVGEAASESGAGGLRLVPRRVAPPVPDQK